MLVGDLCLEGVLSLQVEASGCVFVRMGFMMNGRDIALCWKMSCLSKRRKSSGKAQSRSWICDSLHDTFEHRFQENYYWPEHIESVLSFGASLYVERTL